MNIKGIKNIDFRGSAKKLFSVWENYNNVIFVVFFCALSAYGAFLMYQGLYNSEWSDEQKNEYMLSQQKSIRFDENKLMEIVSEADRRKNEYEKNVFSGGDIFIPPLPEAEVQDK